MQFFMMQEQARGERGLCGPREMVGTTISTVCMHLTVLRNTGLDFALSF